MTGTMTWVAIFVAALFGLLIGSFLNVVIYRTPLGLSVSTPRSFCPTCDRSLAWWENVPVVSWVALRGKCHTCHEAISARYPLVEAAAAAIFSLVTWAWDGSLLSAGYCVLAATAIAVCLIEYGGQRAPLSVGAVGAGLGLVLVVAAALWLELWTVLAGSCAGLTIGILAFAILRARDPDCGDQRWHGRSLLPAVGCWLGGLCHGGGAVAGLAAWIIAEFACMVALWISLWRANAEGVRTMGSARHSSAHPFMRIVEVPLVTGIAVAMTVSLIVAT